MAHSVQIGGVRAGRFAFDVWGAFTLREQAILVGGSAVCICVAYWLAGLAGVPAEPGFGGSLLVGPGTVGKVVAVVAIVAVGLATGAIVAGAMGVEGATFCAALGLAAVAVRCGPMRPVLAYAGAGRGTLVALAVEVAGLGAILFGTWYGLRRLVPAAALAAAVAPGEVVDATLPQKLSAFGITAGIMAAVQLVLVQNDTAAQCLAGVAIGGFLGTLAGYAWLPLPGGAWYWTAPAVTGVAGYLVAAATGDGSTTGELTGWFAALARPTPLHYASLGTAAAVFAHWTARRWALADSEEEDDAATGADGSAAGEPAAESA